MSINESVEPVQNNSVVLYFESDQVDAVVEKLRTAGIDFEHEPVDKPWLWQEARLDDPDGNPLGLFSAGKNRLDPPWKVRKN